MTDMGDIVDALRKDGVRDRVKILTGEALVTQSRPMGWVRTGSDATGLEPPRGPKRSGIGERLAGQPRIPSQVSVLARGGGCSHMLSSKESF